MKKDILTSIEFADTHITLLQAVTQRGQPVLTHCDVVRLEGHGEEAVARALQSAIANRMIANLTVLIPGRYAILKQVLLPSHSDEEIQRMVGLQIGHLGPFSPEEIVFNHVVLEKISTGYARVLIVIVQKENIQNFLRALQKRNYVPHKLVLAPQGIQSWYRHQKKYAKLPADEGLMLLDVDSDNTEICFCRDDKLFFSRSIRFGARDLDQDKINLFMEQIGLTIGTYRREEMGPPLGRIVVISNSPRRDLLTEKLQHYYRTQVDVFSSLDHISCDKSFILPERCRNEGISLSRAVGFLLGTGVPAVNLMPREVLDNQVSRVKRKAILKFSLALFLTCLLGVGVYSLRFYFDSLSLGKIEQRVVETESMVKKARAEIDLLRSFEQLQKKRIILSDILRELYRLTPEDISYHSLSLDAQGNFDIQAYALTGAAVNRFQSRLVGTKLFSNVNLQYATKRIRFREEYTEFKIICQLNVQEGTHARQIP